MEKASLRGQLIRSQGLETLIGHPYQLVSEDLMERWGSGDTMLIAWQDREFQGSLLRSSGLFTGSCGRVGMLSLRYQRSPTRQPGPWCTGSLFKNQFQTTLEQILTVFLEKQDKYFAICGVYICCLQVSKNLTFPKVLSLVLVLKSQHRLKIN